jgi:hypothetical protein
VDQAPQSAVFSPISMRHADDYNQTRIIRALFSCRDRCATERIYSIQVPQMTDYCHPVERMPHAIRQQIRRNFVSATVAGLPLRSLWL